MSKRANDTTATGKSRPIGIFVLGMHRSGTSVLTRALNLLGAALPADLLGSNSSNPTGHWESARAIAINDELLAALGRRWDDVRELPEDWLQRPETRAARQQIRALLDHDFSSERLWLIKEPRICRLAPLWLDVAEELGVDTRVIIPVRHPSEVIYSLSRRDGMGAGQAQLLWCQHLLEAERASRGRPRILLDFDRFVTDWRSEAARIESELGLSWPHNDKQIAKQIDAFISPSLRHADASNEEAGLVDRLVPAAPVGELYDELLHAEGKAAWTAIAKSAQTIARIGSLFTPAIDDLARVAEANDRRAAQMGTLVSSRLTSDGAWLLNEAEIRQLLGETEAILKRVDGTGQLSVEVIRQIEAQREELRASGASRSSEAKAIFSKIEQQGPLVAELARQVEAQREELRKSTASLSGETHSIFSKLEQHSPLVVELARQIEAQREELRKGTASLSGETHTIFSKIEQQSPLVAELARQVEAQREEHRKSALSLSTQAHSIFSKIEQQSPLVAELVRQVEAQRAELDRSAASAADKSRVLRSLIEESAPLVVELARQIEGQRGENRRSTSALAEESLIIRTLVEQAGEQPWQ